MHMFEDHKVLTNKSLIRREIIQMRIDNII